MLLENSPVPLVIGKDSIITKTLFDVFNPALEQVSRQSSDADSTHARAAVASASKALETWRETSAQKRRAILFKAAEVIDRRYEELKQYMRQETGADDGWIDFNLATSKECLLDCGGRIITSEGKVTPLQNPSRAGLVVKEPYGVVFAMAPWNAPYILGFRAVLWPIAAGNTVVLKGSELSPCTLWAVCSVLQEAGLPDGVLNYLTCQPGNAPEVTETIIASKEVRKINFTGSTRVGSIVAQLAALHLKPVLLELGGKSPAIVCHDADLDIAGKECVLGAFLNSGQICMSTERILVHSSIYDEFIEKLRAWVSILFPDANDAPVLIAASGAAKNRALVQDALEKGASLVCGNLDATESTETRLRPLIIGNVAPTMEIYSTESFGPTVSLIKFEEEDEAVKIANDTEYGLSSAVFSRDLRRALKVAGKIESGAVHINHMTVGDDVSLPHGGAKASGFGRFGGGLDEWVRTKNITYDL
ncbi:aldehyde dehydrogenase [Fusarium beomiforme]|uniref:Aldehyde dehydrogenase n=1 Tax=Fusarium beomiforme TaxID=44412 RepID=A0A9P5A9Q1_9HYPO|nr:aldehyde dehydrogenase [Fusarium beomiforme]